MILLAVVLILMSVGGALTAALKRKIASFVSKKHLRYRFNFAAGFSQFRLADCRLIRKSRCVLLPTKNCRNSFAERLNGEFNDNKQIKLAIKNWRGDYLRV